MKASKYLEFRFAEQLPKTRIYEVLSISSGFRLGLIKWYGSWRQYTFFPEQGTVFSSSCLLEIQNFIDSENAIHKKAKT